MKILISIVVLIISGLTLLGAGAAALLMTLPDVHELETCFTTSMYQVHLCADGPDYVKLSDISPYVLHAVIASEDGTFYSHDGFDWHEMEESLNANMHSGKIRRGGSTLTQQLAKNAFLDKEKSIWRKLKEAYLAYGIEKHYTKDFILEKYLNVVEFGPELYGVKRAADHYFHKSASQLNPLEAAYLAFLLPNPKGYSKTFKTGKLTPFTRRMLSVILKRMSSYGKLSPRAYASAIEQLPQFPWTQINQEAFSERPSSSLDANIPAPKLSDEEALDESHADEPVEPHEPAEVELPAKAEPAVAPAPAPAPEPAASDAQDPTPAE